LSEQEKLADKTDFEALCARLAAIEFNSKAPEHLSFGMQKRGSQALPGSH
jgi:hypothetical protein